MGFSVSGSIVVVLFGLFIALGAYYGSVSNAMELVTDAREDRSDRFDRIHDAALEISSVTLLDAGACEVEIQVNNTGSAKLYLSDTDLLLDNEYRTDWQDGAVVDGDTTESEPGSDLWLPGERLTVVQRGLGDALHRVKVASGPGVADSREVGIAC